jgi:hypothetical protein
MKVRFLILAAIVLTAAVLSVALGADNQQQPSDENSRAGVASVKELYAMVKKPTTPIEVLKNIKFAVDHELLIREDFYTDENLKRFIGGTRVKWGTNKPTSKSAVVYGLDDIYEGVRGFPGMGIDVRMDTVDETGKSADHGRIRAGIVVQMGRGLMVEDVERVLGPPNQVSDAYRGGGDGGIHSEPMFVLPKTHPLGNTGLEYPFNNPASKAKFAFLIDGDGTVNRYNAYLEVK